MEWYKRDPSAALAGMAQLNPKQRGIYGSLIDLLYARDGQLIDDDRMIAHAISVDIRAYRTIKTQLIAAGKLWLNHDGFLRVKRFDQVFQNYQKQSHIGTKINQRSRGDRRDLHRDRSEKPNDFNGATLPRLSKNLEGISEEEIFSKRKSPPSSRSENTARCAALETSLRSPPEPQDRKPLPFDELSQTLRANIAKHKKDFGI
jgi:hypothetical protein